jgi:cbb3-type cytochrome oxidase subunit 1
MLEAVTKDLVFTISLKRSTQNLQLSTSWAGRLHHLWGCRLRSPSAALALVADLFMLRPAAMWLINLSQRLRGTAGRAKPAE